MILSNTFWINVFIMKLLGVGVQTVMGLGYNQFIGIQGKGTSSEKKEKKRKDNSQSQR